MARAIGGVDNGARDAVHDDSIRLPAHDHLLTRKPHLLPHATREADNRETIEGEGAEMIDEPRWYWVDSGGLAWVRENLPGARVERHRRVMFAQKGMVQERRDEEAIVFPRGGLAIARKNGLKPRAATVEIACGVCERRYVPRFQDDPCIAGLRGVIAACCGHGGELGGYILFENGPRVALSGPDAITRRGSKPLDGYLYPYGIRASGV